MDGSDRRQTMWFLLVVLLLSLPFWLIGPVFGSLAPLLGANLPVSALQAVCPAIGAVIVAVVAHQNAALRQHLTLRGGPWWLWAVAVVGPAATVLFPALIADQADWPRPGPGMIALAVAYLAAASCEEIGWTGFLLPRLARFGDLRAGITIGVIWAAWHIVGFWQAGNPVGWIAGQCLFTIVFRVLLVRLARLGGESVWPPVVAHAAYNLAWNLSPDSGAGYDPWAATVVAASVTIGLFSRPAQPRW